MSEAASTSAKARHKAAAGAAHGNGMVGAKVSHPSLGGREPGVDWHLACFRM